MIDKNNSFLKEIGYKPSKIKELQIDNDFVPSIFVLSKENVEISDSIYKKNKTTLRFNEQILVSTNDLEIKEKESNDFSWAPFSIIMFGVLMLALAREMFKNSYLQLFESVISIKKFGLWQRDISSKLNSLFWITIPVYLMIFPLVIYYYLSPIYDISWKFSWQLYLGLFGLISLFFALRMALIKLSAFLFMITDLTNEHLNLTFVSSSVQIILLIPLIILGFYQDWPILRAIVLLLVIGFETFRIIRIFISGIIKGYNNPFYFFLYFCSIEIIPLLLIIKTAIFISTQNN